MLIIVSGCETIHRKWIARQIRAQMNTFQVDGYSVDFTKNPYQVLTTSTINITNTLSSSTVTINAGQVVLESAGHPNGDALPQAPGSVTIYSLASSDTTVNLDGVTTSTVISHAGTTTLIKELDGIETVGKIEALNQALMLDGIRDNHFSSVFIDMDYIFGITTATEYATNVYLQPTGYQDVINNYNNRTIENFTISGAFDKTFIDRIRNDLGSENVTVINIIRNPTVAYMLHYAPQAYFDKNTTYTREFHDEKAVRSIVSSAYLSTFSDIQTVKFEDYLANGKITVNGVDILLPPGHVRYNQWITEFEKNAIPELWQEQPDYTDASWITAKFNQVNSDFSSLQSISGISQAPDNLFTLMGYTTIDYPTLIQQ